MPGTRRIGALLPLLVLVGGLLTACTSDPVGTTVTPAATPSAIRTTVPVPTPTTPPPTQNAADATPVHLKCGKLVPLAVAQQLSPDLARVEDWTPTPGTPAAQLAALNGTACAWTDQAGDLLQVAIAKPSKADATRLKNDLVRRSNSVPTYGGEAYFQVVDHVGEVDAFRGRVWISARSNRFFEPGDAQPVVAAVDAAAGTTPTRTASPSPTDSSTPSPTSTP